MSENIRKLTKQEKRSIKRNVNIKLQINPPKSSIYKNKKKYTRKSKHKDTNSET
jgi:hypothetical protein